LKTNIDSFKQVEMEDFDKIISGWKNQSVPEPNNSSEIIRLARERLDDSRKKHLITITVLGITLLVIALYAVISHGKGFLFMAGIGLMITSLLVRILIEWNSSETLKKINVAEITSRYLQQLTHFYQLRKRIHGWVTLALFGFYLFGFLLLLPLFKQTVSQGFFIYILVSGLITFSVLIYFIGRKTREELKRLNETIDGLSEVIKSLE